MTTPKQIIVTGNEAVARIAYKTNEVFPIYPITPASEMSELVERYSAEGKSNVFGSVPTVIQMQSEAGVAGAMHGAIQTGSLSSTFTASQGLLLMLPNMYKIAGELTPNVIHIATRTVATHALSVFGDHSDIMAVRQSGYAFLGSSSVQEAQDFALISHIASINSNIPFVHFFDGFRTSHETAKIEAIPNAIIKSLINSKNINAFKNRALNPNNPVIRGTAQEPDVYFQNREASNKYYNDCPDIVQKVMDDFAILTGRQYHIFEYTGHPEAEHIIVSMASSTETIEETLSYLNDIDEKTGLIKVRLFRPFSVKHFIDALPKSVETITVLDRTKESGAIAEPLCLDVTQAFITELGRNKFNSTPTIIGGRYGLSSKEFTPAMVKSIITNAKKETPKQTFTVGINDDVTNLSLSYTLNDGFKFCENEIIIYSDNSKKKRESLLELLKLIGEHNFVQTYTECSYKKSNTYNKSHIRVSDKPIKAPYLITNANLTICKSTSILTKKNVFETISNNGKALVITNKSTSEIWEGIPSYNQNLIAEKNIQLFKIDPNILQNENNEIELIHLLALTDQSGFESSAIVKKIKRSLVQIKTGKTSETKAENVEIDQLLRKLLDDQGNEIAVSMLNADGTFQTNTSKYNASRNSEELPVWNLDACTQCGSCSMACPLGALRIKAYNNSYLQNAPSTMKSTKSTESDWEIDLLNYTIQINPDQCNGCNNCVDTCNDNALHLTKRKDIQKEENINWNYFKNIPELDRNKISSTRVSQQQLQEPLFKYALGVDGCGEAPYLKLLSQLFGDRMLIANATGASSIFGGALPTTPWSKNKEGKGPAWSNSLFEDNAEFGLGYRLSLDQKRTQAIRLLNELKHELPLYLVESILNAKQKTELQINAQRKRIVQLNKILTQLDSFEASQLLTTTDNLIDKSVWIVGGDGWAYDIGFGGIDHVLASGKNVNILVLDNEVYDNTGGQTSKATPFGAKAAFSHHGKNTQKKNLGEFAMMYPDVYVASVAIGASQEQTLRAFNEAESYDGPSIIIAYCHSEAHGIDMKKPSQYHKSLVDSGQWALYRRDPRNIHHKTPVLQLDSDEPSIKLEQYLTQEDRFQYLLSEQNRAIIERLQENIDDNYTNLKKQAKESLKLELEKYY
jgi:pyruvate-ferredoxin/flavodoxin oxidoreductase